ncbi:DUF1778 domain-containing protein [Fulvimarina sp. MAC8]|uniref:type II toxin-antitoxin system TacA family antitoxin n=1 Tax=Fulvimarina sp. MAC8 TaxID=3162874 RepID=UPI0032ECA970
MVMKDMVMSAAKKDETFTARIAPADLELIRRAAAVCGKSLSNFVMESAMYSAQKSLMDQRFMHLDAKLFDSVSETLSQPAKTHPALVDLFAEENAWATSND